MSWIRLDELTTDTYTLFSKDRDSFPDADQDILWMGIESNGAMNLKIRDSDDWTSLGNQSTTTVTVPAAEWTFVGYSMDAELNAADSTLRMWTNDGAGDTTTLVGFLFVADTNTTAGEIGRKRTDQTTYDEIFKGFIYNFFIYTQAIPTGSESKYGNSGCSCSGDKCTAAQECLANYEFTQYGVGLDCDSSCSQTGCVRSETCNNQPCETDFDYCDLCYDRECKQCSNYESNGCAASKCTASSNALESSGTCGCSANNGRPDHNALCDACHQNCFSCDEGGYDNFNRCTSCNSGYFNIGLDSNSYCVVGCPTHYNAGGAPSCTPPATLADSKIIQYDMSAPSISLTNAGTTGSTHDVTVLMVIPSGHPAKKRGIYFDGSSDALIQIQNLFLSHTLSIHAWVLMKGNNADMTIFSKDRNDFASADTDNLLWVGVNASNYPAIQLAQDISPYAFSSAAATNGLSVNVWYYLAYSLKMETNQQTVLGIFESNIQVATSTVSDVFLVDVTSAAGGFIATERTDSSSSGKRWNGYVYEFVLYQGFEHAVSNTDHATTCQSGCYTIDFDQYDNSTPAACPAGDCLDRSCVRGTACEPVSSCDGTQFCHLCSDRECTICSNYDNCNSNKCENSTNAEDIGGGVCQCKAKFGRVDTDYLCVACFGDCATCDEGGQTNYSDCLTCDSGKYELAIGATSYKFCANYCPTGFTSTSAPTCTNSSASVFSAEFVAFADSWGTGVTLSNGDHTTQDVQPAKARGRYLQATSYLKVEGLQLHTNFSILMWVRPDAVDTRQALFSKDRNVASPTLTVSLYIENDGTMAVDLADSDDSFALFGTGVSTAPREIAAQTWAHVGYLIQMNDNAEDTDITFFVIDTTTQQETVTITGKFFLDDNTPYRTTVGVDYSDETTVVNQYTGFIATLDIYNSVVSDVTVAYGNTGCSGCVGGTSKCTITATNCLENYDIGLVEESGASCDSATCNTAPQNGCVRTEACHTCPGNDYCYLCYDRMCTLCTDYAQTDCTTCDTNSTVTGTGGCECDEGWGRSDVNQVCAACYTLCATCNVGGLANYSDCLTCTAGNFNVSPDTGGAYCMDYCPTGYDADTAPSCTIPGDTKIISWTFDKPLSFVSNVGSAGSGFDVTLTTADPSGHPAKDRGIYFDGVSEGYVQISTLTMSHTWSIHSWVLWLSGNTETTIFSKGTGMILGVSEGKVKLDAGQGTTTPLVSITENTWTYIVYSQQMVNGESLQWRSYVSNIEVYQSLETQLHSDSASDNAYIGAEKPAGTVVNPWKGYIYDLHIYVVHHDTATTTHDSVCAATNCSTLGFDEFDDSGSTETCDGTNCSNRSCVKSGDCQLLTSCTNNSFCHLCADRECSNCTDYTTCEAASCTQTNFASNDAVQTSTCVCNDNYGRSGVDSICRACKAGCLDCDVGGQDHFGDCTACATTHFAIQLTDATHNICINYCPTLYTGSVPNCVAPVTTVVFEADFNTISVGPWSSASGVSATSTNTYPAYERGQYFNGSDAYMQLSSLKLAPSFSFLAYIRLDDLASDITIFSKDRNAVSDSVVFSIEITTTGLLAVKLADSVDSWASFGTATTTASTYTAADWAHIGVTVSYSATSEDADLRLWINADSPEPVTIVGKVFYDDTAAYNTLIGKEQPTNSSSAGLVKGFIYKVWLYNEALGTEPHNPATCNCSGANTTCTDVATECATDWGFNEYADASSCNADATCDNIGCVRDSSCQSCTAFDYCHLCYDRDCEQCDGYGQSNCTTCANNSEADSNNAGQCICQAGFGRIDRNYTCEACHLRCNACSEGGTGTYEHCTECSTGAFNISPGAYKYCVVGCPTGFAAGTAPACTAPVGAAELILSYEFNSPIATYTNAGSATSFDIAPTKDDLSAIPIKDRGLHFAVSNDGYVQIPNLMVSHTFAFHVWALTNAATTQQAIFSKDDDSGVSINLIFSFGFSASDQASLDITKDNDRSDAQNISAGAITVDIWYYIVYSVEMLDGSNSNLAIFVGNALEGQLTHNGYFITDSSSNPAWIGGRRSDNTPTWHQKFSGYLYSLHMYNKKHELSNTTQFDTGCTANVCRTGSYTKYYIPDAAGDIETECDSSCDVVGVRGCVKGGLCDTSVCDSTDFCHLCHDRECTACDTYTACNASQCTASGGNASVNAGNCICNAGFGRADTNSLCDACHDGCDSCTVGGTDDFGDCSACPSGSNDLSDDGSFEYCTTYCPTGFNTSSGCALDPGSELVLSYDFNKPFKTFSNDVSGVPLDITPTVDGPSGRPAKNRGIYFDGTNNGYIEIPGLLLNHSFSFHAWVVFFAGSDITLFSKDRNDFDPATDKQQLELTLVNQATDIFPKVQLAQDINSSNYPSVEGTVGVTASTWTYLVYSLELTTATNKAVKFFIDNVEEAAGNISGVFHIDHADYKSFIGIERTAVGTYANQWNGYIYDFHVYQKEHQSSLTTHASTCGAGSDCRTIAFNEWWDGSQAVACASPSCDDISCVRTEDCQAECSGFYCHLCPDRECTECTDYDTCAAASCGTNAAIDPDNTALCKCNDFFGRVSVDVVCQACHTNCQTCATGGLTNYSDCTVCGNGTFEIEMGATYKYCLNYCPTGFTAGSAPVCTPNDVANNLIYSGVFSTIDGPWPNNSITATASATTLPAKQRGQHFSGTDSYMTVDTYTLGPNFTITAWIRADNLDNQMALFTKDRNSDYPNAALFTAEISATTGTLQAVLIDPSDNSTSNFESTGSAVVAASTWEVVGFSIKLNESAVDSDIRLWVGSGNGAFQTIHPAVSVVFLDDPSGYTSFIGTQRVTDATTYSNCFVGFVYSFYIYNQAYNSEGDSPRVQAGSCDAACNSLTCTDVDTQCLGNWEFTEYSPGNICQSTCLTTGCVRDEECALVTCNSPFEHCDLCFDRECTECTGYEDSTCATSKCNANGNGYAENSTNDCACTAGNGRSSDDVLCSPCHTNCDACTTDNETDYSGCTACVGGSFQSHPTVFFCVAECPTGYTSTGAPNCEAPTNFRIISYYFNYPSGTFTNVGDNTGSSPGAAIVTKVNPNGHPAKDRGLYFDGGAGSDAFIQINAFVMGHSVSVYAWVLLKADSTKMAVFSKNPELMILGVNDSTQIFADLKSDQGVTQTVAGPDTLVVNTWYSMNWSFEMFDGEHT